MKVSTPSLVVAVAVIGILAGCSTRFSDARTDTRCFTDSDCKPGASCDPFERVCVVNKVPGSAADTLGGDATSPRVPVESEPPPAPVCAEGAACDDGDSCTAGDACDAEGACAGASYSCDDGFDCTIDVCDAIGGCAYTVAAARCLIDGVCVKAGDAAPSNACAACLPAVDLHRWSNDDTNDCDDGDACTEDEGCKGGECSGGEPLSCDDEDPCTLDQCDSTTGCVHEAIDPCE